HGGMGREERKRAQEAFTQDKTVEILVATDAAGEGINLQRAHLMVNYDLPWNPNRLEQRFGRIHRIGQTEVCHLWNLIAAEVREVREEMERAEARRLQPHFIASFFMEAFRLLGGSLREREPQCYEIAHVPSVIRQRDRQIGTREVVSRCYERIVFEKEWMSVP